MSKNPPKTSIEQSIADILDLGIKLQLKNFEAYKLNDPEGDMSFPYYVVESDHKKNEELIEVFGDGVSAAKKFLERAKD